MSADNALLSPSMIVTASPESITVMINGKNEPRSWHDVTSIGSTLVSHEARKIFVLVLEFDDLRTFIVREIQPVWQELIDLLHVCLPGVEPFTAWGPRLIRNPSPMTLYERAF